MTCRRDHTFHGSGLMKVLNQRTSSDRYLQHGQPPPHAEPGVHTRTQLCRMHEKLGEAGASLAKMKAFSGKRTAQKSTRLGVHKGLTGITSTAEGVHSHLHALLRSAWCQGATEATVTRAAHRRLNLAPIDSRLSFLFCSTINGGTRV